MAYRFGSCELRPQSRELLVDGQPRSVEPQVFDLLCLLAREADRVISHDELIAEIWGGRIVSDSAISARISAARTAIGDDGASQRYIRTFPRRGFRFVCAVDEAGAEKNGGSELTATVEQQVHFARSADGTRIAYAETGSGYPLVKAGHWLTHLEYDWHSPIWRPLLDQLSRDFRVVRYDQRGNGLSDWDPPEYSLERFVDDLAAVVDAAALKRFALYGTSQGAAVAIAYACRFPERVSHLILQGGYEAGRLVRSSASERSEGEALVTLMRHGWGKPESAFLKMFSAMFIPDGTKEEIDALAELQRMTTTAENALRIREAVDRFDVRHLLANVAAPTLVLHARNDSVHPLDQGRKLAAGIRDPRFVMLESANHVTLPRELAWDVMLPAVRDFVRAPHPVAPA
jgi:pimeloyl-ACP methyl ester carboxylesterase/DNA-binding winged helix-turn-helix (wHTH) protein